ncbi:hypothetical protein [Paraburkholderia sp. BL10I2N1]|uniref:hypothetical protein n=1 Tax=Paraburkholderia sp. BL10I2N1 TaxID=1938796 RepID=UPI00105DD363|nr:hypothetical protein [Paraburkholderia sp. BL10I2N1]TDN62611.1 hypothetical protein B0G77_6195 [Paraburkholderia sp. BL10I2N1]
MSYQQRDEDLLKSQATGTRECWMFRRRLAKRIADAEKMISYAMDNGIDVNADDLSTVRRARHALWHFSGSEALEAALYNVATRLAKLVHYPNSQVAEDLRRAEELVSYAAFSGNDVAPGDIQALSQARTAQTNRAWDSAIESAFYSALDRLAHRAIPVVAETAGAEARRGARRAIRIYTSSAVVLTFAVVSLSCLLFTVNQISEDVEQTIRQNDAGAMSLHNQLVSHGDDILRAKQKSERELRALLASSYSQHYQLQNDTPEVIDAREKAGNDLQALSNSQPALQIKESLQKFATNNRQLFNDVHRIRVIGRLLNVSVTNRYTDRDPDCAEASSKPAMAAGIAASAPAVTDWICDQARIRDSLEIKVPMLQATSEMADASGNAVRPESVIADGFVKIAAYQDIRAMALYGREIILSFVGAITGFVLPVLYAWLGACAAILRKIKIECETSRFHPEYSKVANRSHVTCAIIVGIAIGLFSDLVHGGQNISPLGVAFVAGYASDKFFYFVDRLVDVIFPARSVSTRGIQASDRNSAQTGTSSGTRMHDPSTAGLVNAARPA